MNLCQEMSLNSGNFDIFQRHWHSSHRLMHLSQSGHQARDAGIACKRCQLLSNGVIKTGQSKVGIDLCHWCEDKGAMVSAGMGKLQFRMIKYQAPPANQIKVECSGRVPAAVSNATKVFLYGLKVLDKVLGSNPILHIHLNHSVYKIGGARRAINRRAAEER